MHGHAVMGEQGVLEGAEHAPLRGPSVEDQQSGNCFLPSYLGVARQKVLNPIAQGGVETQGLQLNDELGGYYGVEC